MVSLMPQIPLPNLSNAVATPVYEKKRKYTLAELATFKFNPADLTLPEIRAELNYYKDNNDYRGPLFRWLLALFPLSAKVSMEC